MKLGNSSTFLGGVLLFQRPRGYMSEGSLLHREKSYDCSRERERDQTCARESNSEVFHSRLPHKLCQVRHRLHCLSVSAFVTPPPPGRPAPRSAVRPVIKFHTNGLLCSFTAQEAFFFFFPRDWTRTYEDADVPRFHLETEMIVGELHVALEAPHS